MFDVFQETVVMKYVAYSIISILFFSSSLLSWEKFGIKEHHYVSSYYYPSESNCEVIIDLEDFEYYGEFSDYLNKKMNYDYNVTLRFRVDNHVYTIIPMQNLHMFGCNRFDREVIIGKDYIIADYQRIVDLKQGNPEDDVEELFLNEYNPMGKYPEFHELRFATILNIQLSDNSKIELLKKRILLAITNYERVKELFPEAQFNIQIAQKYPELPPPPPAPRT